MKVHIWRTWDAIAQKGVSWCSAEYSADLVWATRGELGKATCLRCLTSYRDHLAWRIESDSADLVPTLQAITKQGNLRQKKLPR